MTAKDVSPSPVANWRLVLPLVFQAALVLAIPAQALYTQLSGRTVVLQTVPVDPYDWLRGYSQTLRYDISSFETLQELPGWNTLIQQTRSPYNHSLVPGTRFYVILEAPSKETENSFYAPTPWQPVGVSRNYPSNLPENQVALEGRADETGVNYGLETYYFPEAQRDEINTEITQAQEADESSLLLEVKIDRQGNSLPVTLWVRDRKYRF